MKRLYIKFGNRFKPMDWNAGRPVGNLIYATLFTEKEVQEVETIMALAENAHLNWELRTA